MKSRGDMEDSEDTGAFIRIMLAGTLRTGLHFVMTSPGTGRVGPKGGILPNAKWIASSIFILCS